MSATTAAAAESAVGDEQQLRELLAGDRRWRAGAECRFDAPENWTIERTPRKALHAHQQQVCGRCPVRRACAAEAIVSGAQCGTYAGVFVPAKKNGSRWAEATNALRAMLGLQAIHQSEDSVSFVAEVARGDQGDDLDDLDGFGGAHAQDRDVDGVELGGQVVQLMLALPRTEAVAS